MSRNARIVRAFGDGRHEFFLGIAQLDELDEKTGVGPGTLLRRMAAGDMRPQDVRQTLRLALNGGGMKSGESLKLVERYVDPPNPLFESLPLALDVLAAALYADTPKRKKKAEPEAEATTGSTSKQFTETVQ